jgi:2-dehydro-3-deoxyglucarate aldolase
MARPNRLRELVEQDEAALGAQAATFHPALVEVYGDLGLDFVWLDFEHAGDSPWNSTALSELTRAADLAGIELFVRIPHGEPPLVRKVLDAGVRNLLIPQVDSAEEVRRAVEATRFVYDGAPGNRGVGGWRSSDSGAQIGNDYTGRADETVMVGAMIERRPAVENLDDILDVDELGFAFVGPADLSVQLGHPEEMDHPEVRDTITEIEQRVPDSDVALAGIGHGGEVAADMIDRGYQIVRLGGEFEAAKAVLGTRMNRIQKRLGDRYPGSRS